MLATFLYDAPETFSAEDAVKAVRTQIDTLPGNVFVDPEVRSTPEVVVANAITALVHRGTLVADDGRYRLTARRTDPRFEHVPDMIAFQRNMLEETLACARRLEPAAVALS